MSFYSETLIAGGQGRFIKVFLAAFTVFLLILTISLWVQSPVTNSSIEGEVSGMVERGHTVRSQSNKASYQVVVIKDLFMPTRRTFEKAFTGGAAQNKVLPRTATTPPKATLLGTVLLHGEEAALISVTGSPDGPNYYKIGDNIGNFVVKEIGTNSVLLTAGGQIFEIDLTPSDKEVETTLTQSNMTGPEPASAAMIKRQRRTVPNRLKRGQKPQRFKGRTAPPL